MYRTKEMVPGCTLETLLLHVIVRSSGRGPLTNCGPTVLSHFWYPPVTASCLRGRLKYHETLSDAILKFRNIRHVASHLTYQSQKQKTCSDVELSWYLILTSSFSFIFPVIIYRMLYLSFLQILFEFSKHL